MSATPNYMKPTAAALARTALLCKPAKSVRKPLAKSTVQGQTAASKARAASLASRSAKPPKPPVKHQAKGRFPARSRQEAIAKADLLLAKFPQEGSGPLPNEFVPVVQAATARSTIRKGFFRYDKSIRDRIDAQFAVAREQHCAELKLEIAQGLTPMEHFSFTEGASDNFTADRERFHQLCSAEDDYSD